MQIRLTKRSLRAELACRRADGSHTSARLGPGLPFHDLAHFVVERQCGLRRGFFGNIAAGYALDELADKAVIRALGAESWTAEVLARALGSLATGACTPEGFCGLVEAELDTLRLPRPEILSASLAASMQTELQALVGRYNALPCGESLRLEFE